MFQILDDKGECVGIYKDGELHFNNFEANLDRTWNYVTALKDLEVDYAYIYSSGKSLDECCPDELKPHWKSVNDKLRAFVSSFIGAKVSLKENCFFDLVPERFLKEYCEVKNRICQHVFENYEKPSEYTFYREFSQLIGNISNRELRIDKARIADRLWHPQGKNLWQKVNDGHTSVKFNIFSSVTGRLTSSDRSFPVLTIPKLLRDVVLPKNDWFVELDLNAAEMRIALALAGQDQPEGDLHDLCRSEVFNNEVSRAEAKTIATKWLYNSSSDDVKKYNLKLSKFYNKDKLLKEYWRDGYIHTPYGRKIQADLHHAISYLNQSTLIDMWHRQLIKADKLLDGKSSFLSFPLHDCGLFDLKEDEKNLLPTLIKTLSDTEYGYFPVRTKIGPDFGNMKKVNIKVE